MKNRRRSAERRGGIEDGLHRLVVDLDQLRGFLRGAQVIGSYGGNQLAMKAYLI
jgi:hypothetical protein